MITKEFVDRYIDKIFATPEDNHTLRLEIKIFTGERTEKFLHNLKRRTGHTFKIVYRVCCGMDVHKSFVVACIASTNAQGVTSYKSKRFSSFTGDLRRCAVWLSENNCLDNAVIENFFGLLKSELLYLQEFQSMEHFKQELVEYLDYYNNRRIKAKLKGLPPAIHRQQALLGA